MTKKNNKKGTVTTTMYHSEIADLLKRNPLTKECKFNAEHDWLEYTSWDTQRGVDYTIYTFKDADIQFRAFNVALTKLTRHNNDRFDVVYYNMKTGEKFMAEPVIESVKLMPVPSQTQISTLLEKMRRLSSDGMDDRPW